MYTLDSVVMNQIYFDKFVLVQGYYNDYTSLCNSREDQHAVRSRSLRTVNVKETTNFSAEVFYDQNLKD